MADDPLFLRALRGESVERLPAWVMRQAGRYLPEYRAVRAEHSFLEVCRSPELACEVTLQPLRRFPFDAAIVFSDIMMPLEAMGIDLAFAPGPVVAKPLRDARDVERLQVGAQGEISPYVGKAIALLRRELKVPLIGFAGAPLTLAAYLVEGKGSKDFARLRAFFAGEPAAARLLMDKLAKQMLAYLRMQVEAGAQAVQLFDSWAGIVDEATYRQFALPAVQTIFDGLADLNVPRIYFAQQAMALWPAVSEVHAEALGVDWRQTMPAADAATGHSFVLQGNLDPAVLFASEDVVRERTRAIARSMGGRRHVFNLGHGILPQTPIDNVHAMLEEIYAAAGSSTP